MTETQSNYSPSPYLVKLFSKAIEYTNIQKPYNLNNKSKKAMDKSLSSLVPNIYINLCNRTHQREFILRTSEEELPQDFKDGAVFLLPTSNSKKYSSLVSRNTRLRAIDILVITGLCNMSKGDVYSSTGKKEDYKCTALSLRPLEDLNTDFLDFMKSSLSEKDYQDMLVTLLSLNTDFLFTTFFKRYDWLNLEKTEYERYLMCQAKVGEREADEASRPLSSVYVGDKANKGSKTLGASFNALEDTEMKGINNLLPTPLTKDIFSYRRSFNQYTDIDAFKKHMNTNETTMLGGRLSSKFNYALTKSQRTWLMNALDLVEVDTTASIFNILYTYVTGSFYEKRIYNVIAKDILETKTLGEGNLDQAIEVLANAIKQPVIFTYNVEGVESTKKLINYKLQEKGLRTRYKSDSHNRVEKTLKRNKEFLERNGKTSENKNLLNILGNCEITANDIVKALYKRVPELRQFMFTSNAHQTQLIESNTLINISKTMKSDNITPYLVHDGFYVPSKYEEKYSKLLVKKTCEETLKFKAKKLSYFYSDNAKDFLKNMDTLIFNQMNTTQSKEEFTQTQRDFSYFIDSYLGTNSRSKKNFSNLSIWSENDLKLMSDLNKTNVKTLKTKVLNYIKSGKSFQLNKLFYSLYEYAEITGSMLLSFKELNFFSLITKVLSNIKDKIQNNKKYINIINIIKSNNKFYSYYPFLIYSKDIRMRRRVDLRYELL